MNIWIIGVGEPLPIDGESTRLRRVGNLANFISNTENEVHWFSVSFDHYKKIQRVSQDEDILLKKNYHLHVSFVNGYKKNVSVKRIIHHQEAAKGIRKLMSSEKKPDVILAGNTPIEVIKMVAKYGKQEQVPVVVDMRDLWPEIFVEVVPKGMKKLILPYVALCRRSLRNTLKNAYSIIGLSEVFLQYGLNLSGRERKLLDRVIPIGYPNFEYSSDEANFEEKWGTYKLSKDDFIVAFTGNFGRQFDFDSVLEAAMLLKKEKNIKFVLCGTGENMDLIMQRSPDNIVFPGWIEKDMITSLLSFSSVGIAPYVDSINYKTNTPNKFGEYLSASLPILVSVTGSMEDLLSEFQCGFHYKDGKDLSKKILKYYNNRNMHEENKRNARFLYEEKFNGDKVTKQLFDYLSLVSDTYKQNNH